MIIPVICVTLLGLLVFGLGLWISCLRLSRQTYYFAATQGPTDFLTKLSRAHGNTVEYAAFLSVLMLYLGSLNPPLWVYVAMELATLSRFLVVLGFLTGKSLEQIHLVKAIGAVGTYLCGLALCVALILV
jgi:uncharacterized membrane protein YiaA